MTPDLAQIWVYLAREPLTALTMTLLAWLAARRVYTWTGRHPLANPVMLAVVFLPAVRLAGGIDYRRYFEGAQLVHFLLGPATVALAVPLFRQWRRVRRAFPAIALSVTGGGLITAGASVAVAAMLGAAPSVAAFVIRRATPNRWKGMITVRYVRPNAL